MTPLFVNRRKPKRLGRESTDPTAEDDEESGPVIRRPALPNAPKNKSKLRVSFDPTQEDAQDDQVGEGVEGGKALRSSNFLKQGPGNKFLHRSWSPSKSLEHSITRGDRDEDRPTYSKDYLNELRHSTPSTPRDLSSYTSEDDESSLAVDLVSKFGTIQEDANNSLIPTESEIREKKERRARLAKEQDFISLDDDDGSGRYMQLSRNKKAVETRLVRDDEDLAEGFEDYVEDSGRVALGKKAKAVQQKKERDALREMIADAEDVSDEDDSEAERNLAYETTQTRNAMDGLGLAEDREDGQDRAPTIITPIPRLSTVLERLRSNISNLEVKRVKLAKQMADLQQEKTQIAVREIEIQRLVTEAGEKYESLRAEPNMGRTTASTAGAVTVPERGLESLGNT